MENLPEARVRDAENKGARLKAVAIGGSAGGISAVTTIVSGLPASFSLPVVVVLHQSPGETAYWPEYLRRHSALPVMEIEDKAPMTAGTVHCSPAGYHLLLENDCTFSLSVDEKVNFVRPSIDLFFATAAEALGEGVAGVILTGANADGAVGLRQIAECGGIAIVQSPCTAEWPVMPEAALQAVPQALVVDLGTVAEKLAELISSH
jgi:two-component system, chemotaxis family, protein-glutamate methylesterase/glutaminase